ncbi:MAG: OmpH family outer membrane protein [Candidatus Omnitrophota bacterium]
MRKRLAILLCLIFCLAIAGDAFSEPLKTGSINLKKVFYEYKKTKDFNKKLEGKDEQVKEEIEKRTQGIRKLRDEMELLSDAAKEKKQPELRDKIREMEEFRRDKVEGFIREKDEMFKEIRNDILDIAAVYAKKNGYNMIFDEAVLLYSSEKYDVTNDIINELNK